MTPAMNAYLVNKGEHNQQYLSQDISICDAEVLSKKRNGYPTAQLKQIRVMLNLSILSVHSD
jgi:hypothetical protein